MGQPRYIYAARDLSIEMSGNALDPKQIFEYSKLGPSKITFSTRQGQNNDLKSCGILV
jgi:hypothetical protein